ncbi:MAG: hypothetical protein IT536_06435 [Hyphomicrobiales bacterium]|nr:hypothetical protein [Hyphomicrobiales bacterium]
MLIGNENGRPLRALILASLGPVPARVTWAWLESGHTIAEVWTGGPRRGGQWRRDRALGIFAPRWSLASALKRWRIPHRSIASLKADPGIGDRIASLNVDVVLSVHFKLILPSSLLAKLSMPVLNLHPALLPAYRGPSPLMAMLVDETPDRFGGVTLHAIVPGIDAGPIFAARKVPLPASRNLREWELALARAAADLAVTTVPRIVAGAVESMPQDESAAIYRRTTRDDLTITPRLTFHKVAWLTETMAKVAPLTVIAEGHAYPVTTLVRHLGPPTAQPPRVGWRTLDIDIADARVRLRRKPVWEGRRRRFETWLLKVRTRR